MDGHPRAPLDSGYQLTDLTKRSLQARRMISILESVLAREIELHIRAPSRARQAMHCSPCRQQEDHLACELRPRSNVGEELVHFPRNLLRMDFGSGARVVW